MDLIRKMVDAETQPATLRKVGGLLFAMGMFMVFVRKGSDNFGSGWGDLPLLLVLGIPAAGLYLMGLRGDRLSPAGTRIGELAPWRMVFLVAGLVLTPFACFQLVDLLGGTPGADLNVVWIFGLTAVLAAYASHEAKATYMTLLAGVAVIVSWTALWDKVIGISDHFDLYRWVMLALGALVLAVAIGLSARKDGLDRKRSAELVTIAGIAGVIAGGLSFGSAGFGAGLAPSGVDSSLLWEVVLLVVSVALVAYGSFAGARGPTYVGAAGVVAFVFIAGLDLNSDTPDGKILGWPLLLVALGLAGIVASLQPRR